MAFLGSKVGNAVVIAVTTVVILGGAWAVHTFASTSAPTGGTVGADSVTAVNVSVDESQPAPKIGQPAPGFAATALDGTEITLGGGQPVWLVFGATWCANCRAEAPDIQAVAARYPGVQVVSVYVGEPATTVSAYATRLGLTYPQVADENSDLASAFRIMGVPAHFFITGQGVVQDIRVGIVSQAQAETYVDALLLAD